MKRLPQVLVIGGIAVMGLGCASSAKPASPPAFAPVTAPASSAPSSAPPAGPQAAFADGMWEVGKDIKAGRYKTRVPDGSGCYWERDKDAEGTVDSILANGYAEPGTQAFVTVKATDKYVTSRNCGTWSWQG